LSSFYDVIRKISIFFTESYFVVVQLVLHPVTIFPVNTLYFHHLSAFQ